MDIKAILKKFLEGKELSAEERAYLASYDPEGDGSRIPKSRLDQEIAKFKAEKERADKLDADLAELREKVEELENSGKTEAEKAKAANDKEFSKLKKQVEDLTSERDKAKSDLAKSERSVKISTLAAKHSFSDPEYLDYLATAKEIDLSDEDASSSFMKELGKNRPELFKSSAKPGGGTGKSGKDDLSGAEARLKELMSKPELSSRESSEVIELDAKIKAGAAESKTTKMQGE